MNMIPKFELDANKSVLSKDYYDIGNEMSKIMLDELNKDFFLEPLIELPCTLCKKNTLESKEEILHNVNFVCMDCIKAIKPCRKCNNMPTVENGIKQYYGWTSTKRKFFRLCGCCREKYLRVISMENI